MDIFFNLYSPLPYWLVCVLQPCDHLLEKDQPLGSPVCDDLFCFRNFSIRCPGSVLDCIDF